MSFAENWGLITFRETAMLYEQGVSAIGKKMTVAAVISHEIAHQVRLFADLKVLIKTNNV